MSDWDPFSVISSRDKDTGWDDQYCCRLPVVGTIAHLWNVDLARCGSLVIPHVQKLPCDHDDCASDGTSPADGETVGVARRVVRLEDV
jgi:hypothetical protein